MAYQPKVEWEYDGFGTKMGLTIDDGCIVALIKIACSRNKWVPVSHIHASHAVRISDFAYDNWDRLKDKANTEVDNPIHNLLQSISSRDDLHEVLESNSSLKKQWEDLLVQIKLAEI